MSPVFNPPPHTPFPWQDAPSVATPLSSKTLGLFEGGIATYVQTALQALDSARVLSPTPTKTSNYTIVAQDLAVGDASAQSLTFTLPTAPTDGTTVGINLVATSGTNLLTFKTGGTDVLYRPTGPTSDVLSVPNQMIVLQYNSSLQTWYQRSSSRLSSPNRLQFITQPLSPFAASANQYIVADTTGGPTTVNMPTSPPDGTQIGGVISRLGLSASGSPNTLLFVAGSGDAFASASGVAAGDPSFAVSAASTPTIFQYSDATNLWIQIAGSASAAITPTSPLTVGSLTVSGVSGQTNAETERGWKLGAGAPTTGTWNTGDRVDAVSGGSVVTHLCTAGGTPGLWDGNAGSAPVVTYPLGPDTISQTSANLNASVNPNAQYTTWYFEYGTTASYGIVAPVLPATLANSDSSVYAVAIGIAGLTAGTTYHYRLTAVNSSGTTHGSDQTFTTAGSTPTPVITYPGSPTTNITNTSALLNANVNPNGLSTTYAFEYGTTTSYGSSLPTVAGISKVQVGTLVGSFATSQAFSLPSAPTANRNNILVVFVATPNDVVTITPPDSTWFVLPTAANSTNCQITAFYHVVQPGDGTSYTFTRPTTGTISGDIWELTGVDLVKLVDQTATNSGTGTTVTSGVVTPVNSNAFVLTYFLHSGTSANANWGAAPTNGYAVEVGATNLKSEALSLATTGTSAAPSVSDTMSVSNPWCALTICVEGNTGNPSAGNGANPVAESTAVTGLTAGTLYHWRLSATNANGTTHGADQTFTTTASVAQPTIAVQAPSGITQTGVTLNGTVNPNSVNGTTYQWVYGTSGAYGNVSPASPGAVTNGSSAIAVPATLTGLQAGTQYNYALQATNSGGTYRSANQTFTTAQSTSTTIFVNTPDPSGVSVPFYQGCHTNLGDNWNSLTQLASSDPTNPTGRNVFALSASNGSTGLQANNTCSNEKNTAGRYATEVVNNPGASAFFPGAHFFISSGFFIPTHFPLTNFGHVTMHEFFGAPYHLPTFQMGAFFNPPHLLLLGCDYWNQPTGPTGGNPPPTSVNYTFQDFGPMSNGLLGVWHDFLFEFQVNSLTTGNAVGKVNGGTSSQYIPNNDGWMRCWYSKNNNASWTQGSLLTLTSNVGSPYSLTADPNYPNGVPAIDAQGNVPPAGARGINLAQPQMNTPLTGTSWAYGWWTFNYTDAGTLTANGGTITIYSDRVKCGRQLSDVT